MEMKALFGGLRNRLDGVVEDLVLRDIVYTPDAFRKYLAYSCNQMVLAYLAKCKCRDFLVLQQRGLLRPVLGDYACYAHQYESFLG